MENTNEINQKNEKTEKNENIFSIYSKDFSELLEEKDMQVGLLDSYYKVDKYNLDTIVDLREKMKKFNDNFLVDPNLSKIKNTPIFKLCEILKEINSSELKYFEILFNYFCEKSDIIYTLEKFLLYYKYSDLYYSGIGPLKKNLNVAYRNIELRTIDKYIKEKYKKKIERNVTINSKDEIKKAKLIEKSIKEKIDSFNKQYVIDSPNKYLKKAIEGLKDFSGLIKEEDEKKLKYLKKEINSIYEQSKKGEIYEIWNFDSPRIQSEYKFHLLETNEIPLNDKVDINKKDILILTNDDRCRILEKIQNLKIGDKVLDLYGKAGEILKANILINKIIDTNHSKKETIVKEEVEELMKLLVNYNNMRITLKVLNDRRSANLEIKKEIFDILKNIFVKVADYLFDNPNNILAGSLNILSETFYFKDERKAKEHHYICDDIKEHKLFKIDAFWEKVMRYYMDKELCNIKFVKENSEKIKKGDLNEDEATQLGLFIFSALAKKKNKKESFGMPIERIMSIVDNITAQYQKSVRDFVRTAILEDLNNREKKLK